MSMRRQRLQWYEHVCRRERKEDIRMAEVRVQGQKKKGRPKQRWLDTVGDDKRRRGLCKEDAEDKMR